MMPARDGSGRHRPRPQQEADERHHDRSDAAGEERERRAAFGQPAGQAANRADPTRETRSCRVRRCGLACAAARRAARSYSNSPYRACSRSPVANSASETPISVCCVATINCATPKPAAAQSSSRARNARARRGDNRADERAEPEHRRDEPVGLGVAVQRVPREHRQHDVEVDADRRDDEQHR